MQSVFCAILLGGFGGAPMAAAPRVCQVVICTLNFNPVNDILNLSNEREGIKNEHTCYF